MDYDHLNRLTSLVSTPSGSTNSFEYTSLYNAVNQRTKTTLADDSYWDYTYDDLGQVTSGRKYTSAGTQISGRQSEYDLDEIGNRVTSSTPGYIPYTVNDDNQYTVMRDVSLTYDPAGNLLTNASTSYSWDNENRLTQIITSSKLIQFAYDYQGRRIEKKVWNNTTGTGTPATHLKYIYDGWNLIAELNAKNSNAVVRTYSWGPEAQGVPGTLRMISDSNGVYFPAYDPNGNVIGLVKASDGTVCAQYEYLPYGEQVTATGTMAGSNPIRFSTKYYDTEARLYYYGYRYYSSDMGRWLSRDPIEEQGGLNLYGFVNNDPVNKWDLWGLYKYEWKGRFSNTDKQLMMASINRVNERVKVLIKQIDDNIEALKKCPCPAYDELAKKLEDLKKILLGMTKEIEDPRWNLEIYRRDFKGDTVALYWDAGWAFWYDDELTVDEEWFLKTPSDQDRDMFHEITHGQKTKDKVENPYNNAHSIESLMGVNLEDWIFFMNDKREADKKCKK